ncbi:MAG TPA: HDOD domain-containing protein [Povalibacter sp.]|nr:HDOD domain-containing protein [Povalibacter sp.]
MWIAILIVLLAVLAAVLFKIVSSGRAASAASPIQPESISTRAQASAVPFGTEETEAVFTECYRLAFGVPQLGSQVPADHAPVLDAVNKSLDESVYQREYFPRRPMLLPKLLQTLNDSESSRDELVRVLMEDPTLAGSVLQRSNSAYYRTSPEPVESLDRAVFLLGTDGLRSLAAAAILQPVFRMPRGSFENFPDFTWEQAERTAIAAEVNARTIGDAEPIVAQLLGSLGMLANIVLLRLTMDKYREFPALTPRADVLVEAIRSQRACVASLIAQAWKMSDLSIVAFTEQQQRISPTHMSSLGRSVYFGELSGALAMLTSRGYRTKKQAFEIIAGQGSDLETAKAMWLAATSAAQS